MEWCEQHAICLEIAKGIPTALVALVIGVIAALIAWRQYRVAKAKLSLDLFDKRYHIFEEMWKILSEAAMNGTRTERYGLATPFNNFLPQAHFLFGKRISDYLEAASSNWTELHGLQAERNDVTEEQRARRMELERWFFEQAQAGVKRAFAPYLNFERWR